MGGSYPGNSGALEFRYQCCLEGSERCQILSTEGCRSFRGYLRYSSRMPKRNWELYEKRQPMTSLVERKEQPVTSLEMIFCLSLFLPHDGDIISRRKKFPAGEKNFCSNQVCSHSTRKCFLCLPSASTVPPFSRLPSLCKVRTEL